MSPAAVYTSRSGRPSARAIGTRPRTISKTPNPSVISSRPLTPATASSTPAELVTAPRSQRVLRVPVAGGSGRFRIAVTMFMRLTRQAENATTARVRSTPIA